MEAMRDLDDSIEQGVATPAATSGLMTSTDRAKVLISVFVLAVVVLVALGWAEHELLSHVDRWLSAALMIFVAACAATAVAYRNLQRYEHLHRDEELARQVVIQIGTQLRDQIDKQKELQAIVDKSSAIVFLKRAEPGWPVEYISASIQQFGYSTEDILRGRVRLHDLVHPDDVNKMCVDETGACPAKQDECRREYRMVTRSGEQRWVDEHSWTRRDRTGAVTHCQGIIVDITERQQAAEMSQRLASIVESSDDAIYSTNLDGAIQTWNNGAQRIYGYTAEEAIGRPVSMLLPSDNAGEVADILVRVRAGERVEHFETVRVRKDGGLIYVSATVSPIRDSSGEIIGASAVARDITEKRRAEESIRTLSLAIDQSPSSVVITDPEGRIEYVNAKFAEITGYSLEEALGQNPRMLKSGETPAEAYKELWETITAGGEWRGEFHNRKKNGDLYWEAASISGVKNSEGILTHFVAVKEDITERKRMEEALRESERKIRALFDHTLQFIGLMKPDGTLIEANQTSLGFCGADRSDVIGKPFWDTPWWTHSPEMMEKVKNATARAAAGEIVKLEVTHIAADGSVHYVDFSITPVKNEGSKVVFLIPEGRDVTERKQAEEAVRDSQNMLSLIINSVPQSITWKDKNCVYMGCNQAFADVAGISDPEEIKGKTDRNLPWPKEDADVFIAEDLEAIRTNRSDRHVLKARRRTDGSQIWVDTTRVPLLDDHGSVIGLLAVHDDITEQKRAQDTLAREYEITEAMDELKSALLASSTIHEISYLVLEHAKELTCSKIGFVGYMAPGTVDLVATTLSEEVSEACQVKDKNIVFHQVGGILGWVLDSKTPLMTNSPKLDSRSEGVPEGHVPIDRFLGAPAMLGDELVGLVALANASRDYHDEDLATLQRLAGFYALAVQHMREEESLTRRADELARSNADLQQFAYVASHDLQEPLRMISSYLGLLSRRYQGKLDKEADEFIDFAVDGAKRMQQFIGDLLEYSRVDARGKAFEPVQWESVYDETVANLEAAIKESGAVITRDALPTVVGDHVQFVQLLQNLIGNAIKFRGEDAPRIHVSAEKLDGEWRFSVTDNGIGIAAEDHARAFQMFERINADKSKPGTGVGLAICGKIVERHGGHIWVESQLGVGSTFYFTMPDKTS